MEQNTPKFRLRLNLFDALILLIALGAGAFLLWKTYKPQPVVDAAPQNTATVRYTVRFQRLPPEAVPLVEEGDLLMDNVRNLELGRVTGTEVTQAETLTLDHENRRNVYSVQEGYQDLLVDVESPCTATQESITVGGGYILRVGDQVYIKGEGYMASGPIVAMEVEEAQ